MPSSHALNAWSFARVVAGQSHSKWVSVLAYSVATSVSLSRALTGAHSVSDVIVGSALGYGIGEYVLRKRSTERNVPIHHVASNGGDPARALGQEALLQPEGPLKTTEFANAEDVLEEERVSAQGDEPQSISSEQSTAVDIDSSGNSPS